MGKMIRLYTRQNDKTLRQLERDGRIINHRAYVEMHFGDIAPLFMESYDWFTKEAAKMLPKPEDVHAPIWCSISNSFEFFEGRYKGMYPEEVAKIRESWKRAFRIDKWTIFNVCGNIWEIRKEWVRKIVHPGEEIPADTDLIEG